MSPAVRRDFTSIFYNTKAFNKPHNPPSLKLRQAWESILQRN